MEKIYKCMECSIHRNLIQMFFWINWKTQMAEYSSLFNQLDRQIICLLCNHSLGVLINSNVFYVSKGSLGCEDCSQRMIHTVNIVKIVVILSYVLFLHTRRRHEEGQTVRNSADSTRMSVLTCLRCSPAQPAVFAVVLGRHFFQL